MVRRALDSQLRQAGLECRRFESQPIGRAAGTADPPVRALEHAADVTLLDVHQFGAASCRGRRRSWNRNGQSCTRCRNHRALHDVAEFANVAGPRIGLQRCHVLPADRLDAPAEGVREFFNETPDEDRNVLAPLTQRRHADREDVEPVVEIVPERPRSHQLLEIAMGGGDNPHVDGDSRGTPQPLDLPLFQHA